MASEARLQMAKENVLKAGKEAQKAKEEAKTEFDKDWIKSGDESLGVWVIQNYPQFLAAYAAYSQAAQGYLMALQQHDPSAAQEWQKGNQDAYAKLHAPEDSFERNHLIRLPEE